jgi:lipooligosaccharide transport system ATP-binding protein
LVHSPQLILLDEPTVGLDPQIRAQLWTLIDDLRSEGVTILMSTHYIEEAERLADEVALMTNGKIIARGKPSDLIEHHVGLRTAEIYGPPHELVTLRSRFEGAGLAVRAAGPAIAVMAADRAPDGLIPDNAVHRAASLEDVFVLLTGEYAE